MQKNYFLLLILLSVTLTYSQTCPPEIKSSTNTEVVFKIQGGTGASCGDYPANITIDGSAFTQTNCNGANLEYTLDGGETPLTDPDNFTASIGPNTCIYVNGVLAPLSNESFVVNAKSVKMFPNPIRFRENINLEFPLVVDSKIIVYDMLGKQVTTSSNLNSKRVAIVATDFKTGIYVLRVETNKGNFSRKLIVN